MPIAKVQLEDGRIARFEVPEGTTPDQVMSFAREHLGAQAVPEQSPGQREARALGLGVRGVAQGLGAFPGAFYDAAGVPVNLAIRGINALTGSQIPQARTTRENIGAMADAAGLPTPETDTEKLANAFVEGGASALPTAGAGMFAQGARMAPQAVQTTGAMLAANPGTQVVAGGAGQAAQEYVAQRGAGPIAQGGAALLGGFGGVIGAEGTKALGRGVIAAAEPFTNAGQARIVGNVLNQSSVDPEALMTRVRAGFNDTSRRVPGAPVTTAQAAQDTGLAILESGMRNDLNGGANSPAVLLRGVEAGRNQARDAFIRGLSPMPIGQAPDTLGATVRQNLSTAQDKAKAGVRSAFQAIEADGPAQAPTAEIARRVGMAAHDIYGAGSGGMPQNLRAVLDDFQKFGDLGGMSNRDGVSTIQFLQNIRARLGSIGGQAATSGDNVLASAATRARQALDQAVEDFAANGKGVDAPQLDAWRKAIGMRREMGDTFWRSGEGANAVESILRKDQFGAPMMLNERVVDTALSSPSNVRQVLKAAGEQGAPVRQSLKARFMDRFMEAAQTRGEILDAAGNRSTPISPAQARTFWQKNEAIAREIFSPEELAQFKRLMGDFSETVAPQNTAAARGSPTAQNLVVGNMVSRITGGLVDPSSPMAQTVVGLGPAMRLIYAAPEAAVRERLARAIANPQEAMSALQAAGPQGAQQSAAYINQTMRDRLVKALMGEATRFGARTANSLALQ